jgi:hypothetical protein
MYAPVTIEIAYRKGMETTTVDNWLTGDKLMCIQRVNRDSECEKRIPRGCIPTDGGKLHELPIKDDKF